MIPASAHLEVRWINPADISFDPPQPLDLDQVAFYVRMLQGGEQDEGHLAPPLVNEQRDGRYTPRDGRHRAVAHLVLGRQRIRCIVVKE